MDSWMAQLVRAHALNKKFAGSTPAWDGELCPTPHAGNGLRMVTGLGAGLHPPQLRLRDNNLTWS